MTALYPSGRLLWRPAILLALFPLALVTGLAFMDFLSDPALLGSERSAATHRTLWRFAILVPAAVGLFASLLMRELQHTLFAWTLPDLSRKLRLGKLVLGSVLAGGVAVTSLSFGTPQLSVAIFGCSLLTFAIGGVLFDPVLSKIEGHGVALIIVALAYRPASAGSVMELQPLLTGALAVAAAFLLLRREFGQSLSRRRPLTFMSPTWSPTSTASRQYWARSATNDAEWSGSLHRGSTIDWIRAGAHESFGARKGGYFAHLLVLIVIAVVACYFTDNLGMAAIFPWIFVGMSGVQLSSRFLYPINRKERANLFFMSTSADTLSAIAAALVALAVLLVIGPRTQWIGEGQAIGDAFAFLAFFAALAPIGHWSKIRGSYADQASKSAKHLLRYFAFQMAFLFGAGGVAAMTQSFAPAATKSVAAATFVLVHGMFWLALHHHFQTKDLVVAR